MATFPVPFFLARPAVGTAGHPAIVVIMEGNGMSQQLLRVCQRLAHEGYTAIAPDLFHHFGGSDGDKAMAEGWYGKMGLEQGLDDIRECISYVKKAGATSVGITGFCMGGMFTYVSRRPTASTCKPPSGSTAASPTSSARRPARTCISSVGAMRSSLRARSKRHARTIPTK